MSTTERTAHPEKAIEFLRNTHIIWKDTSEKRLIEKAVIMAFEEGKDFAAHQFKQSPSDAQKGEEADKAEVETLLAAALKSWNNQPMEFKDISEYSDYEAGFIQGVYYTESQKVNSDWEDELGDFLAEHGELIKTPEDAIISVKLWLRKHYNFNKEEPQGMKAAKGVDIKKLQERMDALFADPNCTEHFIKFMESQGYVFEDIKPSESSDAGQSSNVKEERL